MGGNESLGNEGDRGSDKANSERERVWNNERSKKLIKNFFNDEKNPSLGNNLKKSSSSTVASKGRGKRRQGTCEFYSSFLSICFLFELHLIFFFSVWKVNKTEKGFLKKMRKIECKSFLMFFFFHSFFNEGSPSCQSTVGVQYIFRCTVPLE